MSQRQTQWLPLYPAAAAAAAAESGQRPTRKRSETTLDVLWRNISEKIAQLGSKQQERWRTALHGEKACLLCSAGGGLMLRCIQGRCEAEFHPWCLVQHKRLNSEVGLEVLFVEGDEKGHAMQTWCARHYEVPTFCVCHNAFDDHKNGADMIACNICGDWFHYKCVGLPKRSNFKVYYCPRCSRDEGSSVTEQEKEKNAVKEAMSVRLTLGTEFAREISILQDFCTTLDKLVNMQRSITEKPTEEQLNILVHEINSRLEDWKAGLADAQGGSSSDGDSGDPGSVFVVLHEWGLFDAMTEWLERAEFCRKAADDWATQAKQLVTGTYDKMQQSIQSQGFFHALMATSEDGLASISAQGHAECDEFLDKVHEIFLYPDYLGTFEAEIRAITVLANGMSKLHTVATETASSENPEVGLRSDVTDLQKALDNLLEDMGRFRGGTEPLLGTQIVSTIRDECGNLLQPVDQLLGCKQAISETPKSVNAEMVKRVLMHITPEVAELVKQTYTELKSLVDQADEFDRAYNTILRNNDLSASREKLNDLRMRLEAFPLAAGVEEGIAYLATCMSCIDQANELLAEPRVTFGGAHRLISQMRQCLATHHGKARLLTAVETELKQHIATFEGLIQGERAHQETAMQFLGQQPTFNSGDRQPIESLLTDSGCLELLQSLEKSRVVWPEEGVLQAVVEVFQDIMNVQELDQADGMLSSDALFAVHEAVQQFETDPEWSNYPFIQAARQALSDATQSLQSRVDAARTLGQRVQDFFHTCEQGTSPALEVAEELNSTAIELRVDVEGLDKLRSMMEAAATVSSEIESALQHCTGFSDELSSTKAILNDLQAQASKVPVRAELMSALGRRLELVGLATEAKRWATELPKSSEDFAASASKLPQDELERLVGLRQRLQSLREAAKSVDEQQFCDAIYHAAFVVSWRAAANVLLRQGGDAKIASELLDELTARAASGDASGSKLPEAEPLEKVLGKAKTTADHCNAAYEEYQIQHQQLQNAAKSQFEAVFGNDVLPGPEFAWLADVDKLHTCLRGLVPGIAPLHSKVEALRNQHNELIVQRVHFHEVANTVGDALERFNNFISNFQHVNDIVGKMKDASAAMEATKLPPRQEPAMQDVELAAIVKHIPEQHSFSGDLVKHVLEAAAAAVRAWVRTAQDLAPQRKTRKSNPSTYPHVNGLKQLLRDPICYAVGTNDFTHLYSLLSLFFSWEEDYRKFLAPGRDVIMAKRSTADSAVDDPFQAVAEAEQLERRVQRIPIRSEEAGILLWAQALFTWIGDVPELDTSTMTWKQGSDRMERFTELQHQLNADSRTKLVDIGVLASNSELQFTPDANPLFEQALNKAAGLREEMAKAQSLAENARALVADPRSQLSALQRIADEAADCAVQPDFAVMKVLYEKLGVAPPAKAADTPTKPSTSSARKRRSALDPAFMPFGDDDDHEDEEYVEDDGEIEEDEDEAYEDPELLAQEMAELRRGSQRKRRSTPAASTPKRKRTELQRQSSSESAIAAPASATPKSRTGAKATSGRLRRCLGDDCRRNAAADSWFCSDTCAVKARATQLQELLRFKSNLANWWCNTTQSRAMGLDQAARFFIRSGDAVAYGADLTITDTMLSNSLKESGADLDALLPEENASTAAVTTDESDGASSSSSGSNGSNDSDASLAQLLKTVNTILEASDVEAPAKLMGWKMDQFCMSLPACAEPLLANVMRPKVDGSKRVLFTAGPAELLSTSAQLRSEDFDKLYGPRLTVRQQFETIFVEAMKDLGRVPDIEGVFLAQELERELYQLFPFNDSVGKQEKQNKQEYRRRYLSLKASLPKNLPLITEVATGERAIATLCTMSAQELANPEVQSRRAKEAEEFKRGAIAEQSLAEQLEHARRKAEGKSVSESFSHTAITSQQPSSNGGTAKSISASLPRLESKKRSADKMEGDSVVPTGPPTPTSAAANVSEHDLRVRQAQKRKTNVLDLLTSSAPPPAPPAVSSPQSSMDTKPAAGAPSTSPTSAATTATTTTSHTSSVPAVPATASTAAAVPARRSTVTFAHPGFKSFNGTCVVTDPRVEPLLSTEVTIVGRMATTRCTEYVEQAIARGTRLISMMVVTISSDTQDAYQEFVNLCVEKQRVGVCDLDPRRRDTKMLYVVPYSMKSSFPMLMSTFPTEEGESKLYGIFVIKDFGGMVAPPPSSSRR